jgi:hypothetical protein
MAHKFYKKQHINSKGFLTRATGPVSRNQRMFWISAFVYQNGPGHYAAAAGTKKWSNGKAPKWECPTEMVPGSQPFNKGPAKAWALALVTDRAGRKYYGWADDVDLK